MIENGIPSLAWGTIEDISAAAFPASPCKTLHVHLTSGPTKCRSLYDDLTEILSLARAGIAVPSGGTRVDKSTLLWGVECGVSSSAGDMLLSVDSLGGVGPEAEAVEEGPTRGNRKNSLEDLPAVDSPAVTCLAQALSIAVRRQRFSSLFVAPSRVSLVW